MLDKIRERLQRSKRVRDAYRTVFNSVMGEEVLRHIAKTSFVHQSTFVAGDPYQTALNEGSRRLALSILRLAKVDDLLITQLIEENYRESVANQVAASES